MTSPPVTFHPVGGCLIRLGDLAPSGQRRHRGHFPVSVQCQRPQAYRPGKYSRGSARRQARATRRPATDCQRAGQTAVAHCIAIHGAVVEGRYVPLGSEGAGKHLTKAVSQCRGLDDRRLRQFDRICRRALRRASAPCFKPGIACSTPTKQTGAGRPVVSSIPSRRCDRHLWNRACKI